MALFGGLPEAVKRRAAAVSDDDEDDERHQQPAVPEEQDELAGLEEAEEQQQHEEEQHLRRRPRRHEEDEEEEAPQEEAPSHLRKRPRHRDEEEEEEEQQQQQKSQTAGGAAPPSRARAPGGGAHAAAPGAPATAPSSSAQEDQVAAALRRITSHIGNPSKFAKASPLLRQLLESGTLGKRHRTLVFDAVRAVFSLKAGGIKHLVDPLNRREVLKLMAALDALVQAGYFHRAERAQILEVYQPLGVLCNEMQTDDGFVFSKVIARLRELVDKLPEAEEGLPSSVREEEDAAYSHVTQDLPGLVGQPAAGEQGPGTATTTTTTAAEALPAAAAAPKPAAPVLAEEEDPFGLGALMGGPALPPPPPPPKVAVQPKPSGPPSSAWGPSELLAARRCAVLMAVQHARTFHKHTWAQTSIELLVEHCWQNKARFAAAQVPELDELWAWVRKAKAARKVGPSAKELNRDTTSFERARKEWSTATVSHRGKVGSSGDAKSANWLG